MQTNSRSQPFGEAKACAYAPGGVIQRPFKIVDKRGNVCPSGYIDFYSGALGMKGHNGEDWVIYYKEKIFFPVDAEDPEVKWIGTGEIDADGGIGFNVMSSRPIDIGYLPPQAGPEAKAMYKANGNRIRVMFRFWHAQRNVSGLEVKMGDLIQLGNSTGASSGNHCHFAMKFVDSKGRTLDRNNGYTGAIDMSYWFENKFILDEIKAREERERLAVLVKETEKATVEIAKLEPHQQPSLWDAVRSILVEILAKIK